MGLVSLRRFGDAQGLQFLSCRGKSRIARASGDLEGLTEAAAESASEREEAVSPPAPGPARGSTFRAHSKGRRPSAETAREPVFLLCQHGFNRGLNLEPLSRNIVSFAGVSGLQVSPGFTGGWSQRVFFKLF